MSRAAVLVLTSAAAALADPEAGPSGKVEPVETTICRLIDASAQERRLPIAFLTRLIWQESSFRPNAVSPAGARGVAQFMPRTADDRGLADPFDPAAAIPKAAELLAELKQRFGNLGLAAAAYNAGPARVSAWLDGRGPMPAETRDYVLRITRRSVEDWTGGAAAEGEAATPQSCTQETASIRRREPRQFASSTLLAPWGVQLVGSFSRAAALASYARAQKAYAAILGDTKPMILGGRVPSRGFAPYYQIRAPAPSRAAANALCEKITRAGGACAVLRS